MCHHYCQSLANYSSFRHLGRAPPGGTGAFRPAEKSSSLDNRRALRESRLRPWLLDQWGTPHSSIDNSKVATRLQELRDRRQAREDATRARSQALRQSARSQAPSRTAPKKASTSPARSQAFRQPARSQATTRTVPDKASTPQVRSQAIRQPARSQATTTAAPDKASTSQARPQASRFQEARNRVQETRNRIQARRDAQQARPQACTQATPEKASTPQARPQASRVQEARDRIQARRDAQQARPQASTQATPVVASRFRPVGESRTMEILAKKERAHARLQETKDGVFASRSRRPQAVAKAHHSESKLAVPEVLPNGSAKLPSSASSTLPSGGQSCSNTQRGAGAAISSARLVSRSNRASTPVADSSLPAGVYEKVMREGSHGPAYTLNKVSWKFRNGWENVFSPPDRPVVLDPEPEGTETDTSNVPRFISPTPRYEEIGKTPVHPDCARPRRRPMAPPLPVPPSDQSVRWPERSETRLTSAGSVAKEGASEKMPGYSSKSRFFHLRHRLGPVPSGVPAHRSAAPRKSSLRTGPSMDNKPAVSFSDRVQKRTISRWVPQWPGVGGAAV